VIQNETECPVNTFESEPLHSSNYMPFRGTLDEPEVSGKPTRTGKKATKQPRNHGQQNQDAFYLLLEAGYSVVAQYINGN
jgi:hypothetical protein